MIHLLHGENQDASYKRLSQILNTYPDHQKIYLEPAKIDELFTLTATVDLLGQKKVVVAQDAISKGQLKAKQLENQNKEDAIIIWEKKEITKSQALTFGKIASVELFKLPSRVFYFLDSISSSPKEAVTQLQKMSVKEAAAILWQLLNRISLLIFAKLNLDREKASKISGKLIQDWQWEKIKNQSKAIDLKTLVQIYQAGLKIDYLTKTGKTDIPQKTLISLLLLKYLKG